MDQLTNNIDTIEAGDPIENFHDQLNQMDTDTEDSEDESEKEPEQKE